MIKPSIGRVVWYWPPNDVAIASGGDQALPALIAHVWSDTCINIAGFDANGEHFNRTSVTLWQGEGERPKADAIFGFCEWMPYQKGQAAKTEALEAKLGS